MKKFVQTVEVENEGFEALLGEKVIVFGNYFYTGKLVGVNKTCILLEDASIVYETGPWTTKTWQSAQKLPHPIYVQMNSIESFMKSKEV